MLGDYSPTPKGTPCLSVICSYFLFCLIWEVGGRCGDLDGDYRQDGAHTKDLGRHGGAGERECALYLSNSCSCIRHNPSPRFDCYYYRSE